MHLKLSESFFYGYNKLTFGASIKQEIPKHNSRKLPAYTCLNVKYLEIRLFAGAIYSDASILVSCDCVKDHARDHVICFISKLLCERVVRVVHCWLLVLFTT